MLNDSKSVDFSPSFKSLKQNFLVAFFTFYNGLTSLLLKGLNVTTGFFNAMFKKMCK